MSTLAFSPGTGAGLLQSTATVTRRALLRYVRTPQLIVMATIQMSMFFLIYRYLFGGAIHIDGLPYVDFLDREQRVFVATGWHGHGFAIAPSVAKHIADWLTTGRKPELLAPFKIRRS